MMSTMHRRLWENDNWELQNPSPDEIKYIEGSSRMSIIDFGEFRLQKKDRTAAYIPGATTLTEDVIIQAYIDNTQFRIYQGKPEDAAVFEVASLSTGRLEVSVKEHIWNRLLRDLGTDVIAAIYRMLSNCIEEHDLAKATATMNVGGRFLAVTKGCIRPSGLEFSATEYDDIQMGTNEGLSKLYLKLNNVTTNGVYVVINNAPHIIWKSMSQILIALLGYPYSRYIASKPYNTDFWATVYLNSPEVYVKASKERGSVRLLTQILDKHPNLNLIDHTIVTSFVL